MIILFSYNGDRATPQIMDYLHLAGCEFRRINLDDEDFTGVSVHLTNNKKGLYLLLKDNSRINLEDCSYFLYRGGRFNFDIKLNEGWKEPYLRLEYDTLTQFFYQEISKRCLGNIVSYPLNKIQQLCFATNVGLNIPDTFITSNEEELKSMNKKEYIDFVCKSIQENIIHIDDDYSYDLKVHKVALNEIKGFFFPSLFQSNIKKSYEIRTFYLDGEFYSISMKCIEEDSNIVDFRLQVKDIQYAKYKLPQSLENKLKKLMSLLNLKTGSIDLIRDKKGVFYFLEVNPTGQFEWVSLYGGYNLEKKIADYLIKKDYEFNEKKFRAI